MWKEWDAFKALLHPVAFDTALKLTKAKAQDGIMMPKGVTGAVIEAKASTLIERVVDKS